MFGWRGGREGAEGRVSSNTADWEGESPPSICRGAFSHILSWEVTIRGTFCEVVASQSCFTGFIKCGGVAIHPLSGQLKLQSAEHFDRLKVALKQGEIDWLHIVLEAHNHCVVTRCAKLCRVATRRQIWWSVEVWTQPHCGITSRSRVCAQPTMFIASMQRHPESGPMCQSG